MNTIRTDKTHLTREQAADWEIETLSKNSGSQDGMLSAEEKTARQNKLEEELKKGWEYRLAHCLPEERAELELQYRIARVSEQNTAETSREEGRKEWEEHEKKVEKIIKKINADRDVETEDQFLSKWNKSIG